MIQEADIDSVCDVSIAGSTDEMWQIKLGEGIKSKSSHKLLKDDS